MFKFKTFVLGTHSFCGSIRYQVYVFAKKATLFCSSSHPRGRSHYSTLQGRLAFLLALTHRMWKK